MEESSLHHHLPHPAVRVFTFAILDGLELITKLLEHLELAKLMLGISISNAGDRHTDSRGAARAHFPKGRDLVPRERACLHLDAFRLRDLHHHLVGDARQDGRRLRRDVCALRVDADEVGHGELLDVFLLDAVEIERGAETRRLRLLEREEVGGVVAPRLHRTGTLGRRTVEVLHYAGVDALHAAFAEVVADGCDGDHEGRLRAGLQPEDGAGAHQERANVQRAAAAVRRDVLRVRAHRPIDGLVEHGHRDSREHEAVSASIHPRAVLVQVAHADSPVFAPERLAALEESHAVVQHGGVDVERDERVGDEAAGVPRVGHA
mmetsp:Transcript_21454/g.51532  ORF Transcript_21454/g.51532 Transcript_21454/m.51532 type:complete len:320 (-) Transcript_21454:256-1215(-)